MKSITIDLNCDLGESYGHFKVGNDELVFPYLSSCNIACGAHGGDRLTIEKTVQLAKKYNVQIGAHPSYPDLAGFGRRKMTLKADELKATIKNQIAVVDGLSRSYGLNLKYVKAHGALYNSINKNEVEAMQFIEAVKAYKPDLAIMGQPNTVLEKLVQKEGLAYIKEGFIDRLYQPDGSLTSRNEPNAIFHEIDKMIEQFGQIVKNKEVKCSTGDMIPMKVHSLCIHGDNQNILPFLKSLKAYMEKERIKLVKSLV